MDRLVGRPLKFEDRESLIQAVQSYFDNTPKDEWTVTGLALVIGSKQLIQDYEKREGYSDVIYEAKLMIENSYELDLRKKGGSGNIFALKNFGWRDEQAIDHTTQGDKINFSVVMFNEKAENEKNNTD